MGHQQEPLSAAAVSGAGARADSVSAAPVHASATVGAAATAGDSLPQLRPLVTGASANGAQQQQQQQQHVLGEPFLASDSPEARTPISPSGFLGRFAFGLTGGRVGGANTPASGSSGFHSPAITSPVKRRHPQADSSPSSQSAASGVSSAHSSGTASRIEAFPPSGCSAGNGRAGVLQQQADTKFRAAPPLMSTKQHVSDTGQTRPEPRYVQPSRKQKPPPEQQPVAYGWNWVGVLLFLYYLAAAAYYFWVRATRTLNIGYASYGALVLAVEIISSTATLGYAVLLTRQSRLKPSLGLPLAEPGAPLPADPRLLRFNLRVLIPCYKEPVGILRETVLGALHAGLPANTRRTIYLCDDLPDPEKEALMTELDHEFGGCVYVTRKLRKHEREAQAAAAAAATAAAQHEEQAAAAKGGCLPWWADQQSKAKAAGGAEVNGKSNNLNNCLRNVIYKDFDAAYAASKRSTGSSATAGGIPSNEVMVVLDADMVAEQDFFVRVLEVMGDDDIALCLTPQAFHNVHHSTDIFNNLNLTFWEYMLPGTDAYRYVACTGTNFCLRVHPLASCGWFPDYSITEDYTLGMELKAKGFKARYLNEYLVRGEAPTDPRGVFKQRSRWCKGQIQILFDHHHSPLLDTGLTLGMRLLYTSVTWNYITNTLAVPCSVLVPFIALVFGVYPLVLNRDFALAATLYFAASSLVTNYCTKLAHLKPVWFCVVSCHLLWFTFTKAIFNVLWKKLTGGVTVFKATDKKVVNKQQQGKEQQEEGRGGAAAQPWHRMRNLGDMQGTLDAWVLLLSCSLSLITAVVGIFGMIDKPYTAQGELRWFLALSIFWALYNMIPPALFIFYLFNSGGVFEEFCSFCYVASFALGVGGIVCTWLVPDDYNIGQVLNVSLQFFEAQRSGRLPRISNVPWRGNSALWDSLMVPGTNRNTSLIGGWYDDGGMVKVTYSTAFTVSMLSWAFTAFKGGFVASGNADFGANTIRWGADYLLKAAITADSAAAGSSVSMLAAQVGNLTRDRAYWGPPERATLARPVTVLTATRPGTDVLAMTAAALASAAVALRDESSQASGVYLARAQALYKLAQRWPKTTYSRSVESSGLYPSTSVYDDLAFAAVWLHTATGESSYLTDAQALYDRSLATERHVSPNAVAFNYENTIPALHLLLFQATGDAAYRAPIQDFVNTWLESAAAAPSSSSSSSPAGRSEASGSADVTGITYTPRGLAQAQPGGTLQHTANAAFLVLAAASTPGVWPGGRGFMRHACWSRNQVGYMLGDAGRSYVTGYGALQPRKTPHKAASCPPADVTDCTWESAYFTTDPNWHTLPGGLVGGPDASDGWADDRDQNSAANTVSLLNNAGLTAALAGLVHWDVNMAKCQQGNGFIQTVMLRAQGRLPTDGARWFEPSA